MSQFPHDQFIKGYLPELLQDYGEVTPSQKVYPETKEIDIVFKPNKTFSTTSNNLGLLGKLASQYCLLEVYRNPATANQIRACLNKLLETHNQLIKEGTLDENLAILWILTPTLSERILKQFGAAEEIENWSKGIYIAPEGYFMGIVVIHQLPNTEETLWLRILGKGRVQEKAIRELKDLPDSHPKKNNILELVSNLLAVLQENQQKGQSLDTEDQELIMQLSTIYLEKLEQAKNQGIQQGLQQGLQQGIQQEAISLVIRQLRLKLPEYPREIEAKITNLSTEILESLAEDLLDFNTVEDLLNWLSNNSI